MSVRTDTVQLIVNVNGNSALNNLNNLRKKAADLTMEMKGLAKGSAEYVSKSMELKTVNSQMDSLKKTIGLTSLSQKELTGELKKLIALRGSVVPFSQEYKDLSKNIDAVGKRLAEVKSGTAGFNSMLGGLGNSVKSFGVLAASYLGFQFITTQFKNIIGGAAKLSDQLADLRRVAGLTAGEANNLNKQLLDLDTRTSSEGLRNIAITAGKLGVAKEDIFGFTKAVDQLVVTLGDELGDADQITTSLGKILNVFDGKIDGDNITRLGNAFVELANSGGATGAFIADFDQRLSGVAKSAGIGLGALSGLGAGLEEMGGNVEASSSAIQRIIINISKDLPGAAKIAGMSTKEFSRLFKEDGTEALLRYSEGLVKNKESFSAVTSAMDDAGEAGVHTVATLNLLGNGADKLRGRIDLGKESIERSTASTEAFRLKNETFGSTLEKLGKQFEKFVTNSGISNFFKGMVESIISLITPTKTLTDQWRDQAAIVQNLEKNTVPLINRYEELKSKTTLNKDEQIELNNIIIAIGKTIPTAISEFDKYGGALDINAKKAREFIDLQQAILKERNRSAISDEKSKLADLEKELKMRQQQLEGLKAAGAKETATLSQLQKNIPGFTPDPGFQKTLDYYSKSIVLTAEKVQALQERLTGVKGIISELDGTALKNALATKPNETTTTTTTAPPPPPPDKAEIQRLQAAAKQRKDDFNKIKEESEKFYQELLKLKERSQIKGEEPEQAEIDAVKEKYKVLTEKAFEHYAKLAKFGKTDKEQLNAEEKLIAEAQEIELYAIKYKYLIKGQEDAEKKQADITAAKSKADKKQLEDDAKANEIAGRNNLAKAQRKIIQTTPGSNEELTAKKELLQLEMEQELASNDLTNEEILLRQAEFNQAIKDLDQERIQQQIDNALNYIGFFQSAMDSLNQAITNRENAQFNKEKALNEKKKKVYKDQLDNKLLSQAQYDKKTQALAEAQDKKERELRRKQAQRDKALNLFNSIVSNAAAIVKTMSSVPFPFNIPLAIAQGIAGGLQIAAIANTPLPELGKGDWIRTGAKHSDASGGINAKIERDEAVISAAAMTNRSIYSVTGTTAQITSALNGKAGGAVWARGAVVQMPKWMTERPAMINPNLPRIMEQGGIVRPLNDNKESNGTENISLLIQKVIEGQREFTDEIKNMKRELHAKVSIKEFDKERQLYDQAKKVSGLS